jgi:hypothetical protein
MTLLNVTEFVAPAECSALFLAPLPTNVPRRRVAFNRKVMHELAWPLGNRDGVAVSCNVVRIRLAFEREVALAWPLGPRPGVTFLFVDWLDDWKPPRHDVWGGYRLRSVGTGSVAAGRRGWPYTIVHCGGWPDAIVRCPPISVQTPLDESPRLAGIASTVDYVRLVVRDLRDAARPRRPRRPDNKAYRRALFPDAWSAGEIRRARRQNRVWAARLPTRR